MRQRGALRSFAYWLGICLLALLSPLGSAAVKQAGIFSDDSSTLQKAAPAVHLSSYLSAGELQVDVKVGSFTINRPAGEGYLASWKARVWSPALSGLLPEEGFIGTYTRDYLRDWLINDKRDKFADIDAEELASEFISSLRERTKAQGVELLDLANVRLLSAVEAGVSRRSWIRTIELDFQTPLGKRRWQGGVNVLGALYEWGDDVEAPDKVLGWQLRGYAAEEDAVGTNIGAFYRYVVSQDGDNPNQLFGVNMFLDYEQHGDYDENFLRWSLGAEYRSSWLDLYLNRYLAITDPQIQTEENGERYAVYTRDGTDVEVVIRSLDTAWLSGHLSYYNWEGEFGDADDKGFRYGVGLKLMEGLDLRFEYDDPTSGSSDFGGKIAYRHVFNSPSQGLGRGKGEFDARDYLYTPVRREYAQRISRTRISVASPSVAGSVTVRAFSAAVGQTTANSVVVIVGGVRNTVAVGASLAYAASASVTVETQANSEAVLAASEGGYTMTLNANTTVAFSDRGFQVSLAAGNYRLKRSGGIGITRAATPGMTVHLLGTELNLLRTAAQERVTLHEGGISLEISGTLTMFRSVQGQSVTYRVNNTIVIVVGDRTKASVTHKPINDEDSVTLRVDSGTMLLYTDSGGVSTISAVATVIYVKLATVTMGALVSSSIALSSQSWAMSLLEASTLSFLSLGSQVSLAVGSYDFRQVIGATITSALSPNLTMSLGQPANRFRFGHAGGETRLSLFAGVFYFSGITATSLNLDGGNRIQYTASSVSIVVQNPSQVTVRRIQPPIRASGEAQVSVIAGSVLFYGPNNALEITLPAGGSWVYPLTASVTIVSQLGAQGEVKSDSWTLSLSQNGSAAFSSGGSAVALGGGDYTLAATSGLSLWQTPLMTLTAAGQAAANLRLSRTVGAEGLRLLGGELLGDGIPLVTSFVAKGVTETYLASSNNVSLQVPNTAQATINRVRIRQNTASAQTPMPERYNHGIAVLGGTLYVVGGSASGYANDVWSSADGGKRWTRKTNAAAFAGRSNHVLAAFNGRLFVIGGKSSSTEYLSDVWSTAEGSVWRRETTQAFGARSGHAAAVLGGALYVAGGRAGTEGEVSEVWKTADGTNWELVIKKGAFREREGLQMLSFRNSLYIIGGNDKKDVWRSADGANWTELTNNAAFSQRGGHRSAVLGGRIFLVGGGSLSDVWSTADGLVWRQETAAGDFSGRDKHGLVESGGILALHGGFNDQSQSANNEVWVSVDGVKWVQYYPTINGTLPARSSDLVDVGAVLGSGVLRRAGSSTNLSLNTVYRYTVTAAVTIQANAASTISLSRPNSWTLSLSQASTLAFLSSGSQMSLSGGSYRFKRTNGNTLASALSPNLTISLETVADFRFADAGGKTHVTLHAGTFDFGGITATSLDLDGGNRIQYVASSVSIMLASPAQVTVRGIQVIIGATVRALSGNMSFYGPNNALGITLPAGGSWVYPLTASVTIVSQLDARGEVKSDLWTLSLSQNGSAAFSRGGSAVALGGGDYALAATSGLSLWQTPLMTLRAVGQAAANLRLSRTVGAESLRLLGGELLGDGIPLVTSFVESGVTETYLASSNSVFLQVPNTAQATINRVRIQQLAGNVLTVADLDKRFKHGMAELGGTLYVVGGNTGGNDAYRNDVWVSVDGGRKWTRKTGGAPFSPRFELALVTLNNRLFLVGGRRGSNYFSDVWSSADGLIWRRETANAFSSRYNYAAAVLGGTLYVSGGQRSNNVINNEVWRTTDGGNWESVNIQTGFPKRQQHQMAALNNSLYIIGGYTGKVHVSDVWSSADGSNWTQVTPSAAFEGISSHRTAVLNGRMFVVGGTGPKGLLSDVWSSADGLIWRQETVSIGVNFEPRLNFALAAFDGRLVLHGGISNSSVMKDDIWASIDGVQWEQQFPTASSNPLARADNLVDIGAVSGSGVLHRAGSRTNLPLNAVYRYTVTAAVTIQANVASTVSLSYPSGWTLSLSETSTLGFLSSGSQLSLSGGSYSFNRTSGNVITNALSPSITMRFGQGVSHFSFDHVASTTSINLYAGTFDFSGHGFNFNSRNLDGGRVIQYTAPGIVITAVVDPGKLTITGL